MSEGQIILRPFQKKDLRDVAAILASSFEDKFMALASLPGKKLIDFLIDSDFVQPMPFEGYVVAELNNKCIGVMVLKWTTQQRMKREFHLYRVIKKYGF